MQRSDAARAGVTWVGGGGRRPHIVRRRIKSAGEGSACSMVCWAMVVIVVVIGLIDSESKVSGITPSILGYSLYFESN
jgi:hypothetical protein